MTVESDTIGRDNAGRFAAGNRAACGQRRRQHMALLRSAFTEAITAEDVERIVRKLVTMASDGDVQAAKLLLDRGCGKISTADSDEPATMTNELGPVTMQNLEAHKRRLLEELEDDPPEDSRRTRRAQMMRVSER